MKIATWNVNSLKIRLPQVIQWLEVNQPDVLCLQETKLQDAFFPLAELSANGYSAIFAGQKTYNGVALLSRQVGCESVTMIPNFADDQKRMVAATYGDVRVVCIYVPNGDTIESEKFQYKLNWLFAFRCWLREELKRFPKLVLLGDFNIAPEDRDVHDPELWKDQVLCSPSEREAFQKFLDLGLHDSFRLFEQPSKSYTWWDYRMLAFRLNKGLRIDHILLSEALIDNCESCFIDKSPRKLERPSDHTPVIVNLRIN